MGNSFRGWYFKCQSPTQTLALIPAIHTCRVGAGGPVPSRSSRNTNTGTSPSPERDALSVGIVPRPNWDKTIFLLRVWSFIFIPSTAMWRGSSASGSLPRFPAILWAPSALFPFWSAVTGSSACGIRSQANSVSMERPITSITIWGISRGTKAALFLAATSGPSVYFRKVP